MGEAAHVGMLLSITNPSVRLGMLLRRVSVFDGVLITLIPETPPLTPRRRPDSRWRSQSLPQLASYLGKGGPVLAPPDEPSTGGPLNRS